MAKANDDIFLVKIDNGTDAPCRIIAHIDNSRDGDIN
jgi:hypothetical protein